MTGTAHAEEIAATELTDRIVAAVREKTGGRVRDARVTADGGVVTVSGIAPSFHLKQLALEAARAALRDLPFRLNLEISVHAR